MQIALLLFIPVSNLCFLFLIMIILLEKIAIKARVTIPNDIIAIVNPLNSNEDLLSFFGFVL